MGLCYAPVAGIDVLQQLQDHEYLGNYLLLLAHDVLDHPDEYKDLLGDVRAAHQGKAFIILDNSSVELGASLPVSHLAVAGRIVEASCIVLPDIMGDAEDTVRATMAGAQSMKHYNNTGIPYMVVPQGKSVPQIYWCIMQLSMIQGVGFWGIPRAIANTIGSRDTLCKILAYDLRSPKGANIHMLGMSHNIMDDVWCTTYPNVMGIDSANPIVMGLKGVSVAEKYEHMARPEDYLKLNKIPDKSIENIKLIRHLMRSVKDTRDTGAITTRVDAENYIHPAGHA